MVTVVVVVPGTAAVKGILAPVPQSGACRDRSAEMAECSGPPPPPPPPPARTPTPGGVKSSAARMVAVVVVTVVVVVPGTAAVKGILAPVLQSGACRDRSAEMAECSNPPPSPSPPPPTPARTPTPAA